MEREKTERSGLIKRLLGEKPRCDGLLLLLILILIAIGSVMVIKDGC